MQLLNKEEMTMRVDPREFNGQFFFTNPDTEDFTASWNGTPYTFTAMSTSPLVILDATPIETQQIRKLFAFKLSQRMFGKSAQYKKYEKMSEGKANPAHYDPSIEYAPFIEQCLSPLPVAKTGIGKKEKKEIDLKIDPTTGKPSIKVYGEKDQGSISLVEEALNSDLQ